jgi:hypothetical protein
MPMSGPYTNNLWNSFIIGQIFKLNNVVAVIGYTFVSVVGDTWNQSMLIRIVIVDCCKGRNIREQKFVYKIICFTARAYTNVDSFNFG